MVPYWVLVVIGAGLVSNLANFVTRYVLRDNKDSASFALSLEIFRILAFGIIALFDFQINWSLKTIILLFLLGFIEPLSIITFMKMHQYNELSISSIISRSRMIWIAILAFIFLGESLRFIDYIGIAILFLGLSIAIAPKNFFVDKGVKIALITAIIAAFVVILMKATAAYVSLPVMMVFQSLPSVFLIPLFMKTPSQSFLKFSKSNFNSMVLFNIFNFIAMYGYIFALKHGSASIVTALYHGMSVFAVLAGIIFLKEREDRVKKIIGAVITIVGVVLLTAV